MRHIKIITVGKLKQNAQYLASGIQVYEKRLKPFAKIEWIELPDSAPSATRTIEQIKAEEARLISKHLPWAERVILLNERGKTMSSTAFARELFGENPLGGGAHTTDSTRIIMIIGGAYGTAETLNSQVTDIISLSPLTFPHTIARLILMEQLYRAMSIVTNDPYHK